MSDSQTPYEAKDEAYFSYYSLLSHQAQMLQDSVRTAAYQNAIIGNSDVCFKDKFVMDVGAGNGILSFFSAQAGAKKVYSIEASNMVDYLKKVVQASKAPVINGGIPRNAWLADRVVPVHSKMEDVTPDMLEGHEKVDTIVSECLGVLLVHERMCESFLDARDRFLKPGGSVFPSAGTICLAPVEDKTLWEETASKARWWQNQNFYGVDITPFAEEAMKEAFSSPVVGCFGAHTLLTISSDYQVDFLTVSKEDLEEFTMPVEWEFSDAAIIHCIGGWFDLSFIPNLLNLESKAAVEEGEARNANPLSPPASSEDATMQDVNNHVAQENQASGSNLTLSSQAKDFAPSPLPPVPKSDPGKFQDKTSLEITIEALNDLANANPNLLSIDHNQQHQQPSSSVNGGRPYYMTTSPYAAPTHWQQVRFLLDRPIAVNRGQKVVGTIHCKVNEFRSYDLEAELKVIRSDGREDELLKSRHEWRLDRQIYSWTTAPPITTTSC
ncbi:S-adenosyl-L-methionine-dependent methyltransferase [Violaceomyces palustris]|uniref:S-adenosyl-L-methionine-dependent methyltransferase n=1 Tax=Violaceomyces palustris TaxID=1673888 RepID=A0ACD0NUX7_9BASI|nr:S-adenosyl-L-methionine-dependent methyltransferase [Violaceomyces palustris]